MKKFSSFVIFYLSLTLILLGLGTWQLYRKQEKESLLKELEKAYKAPSQNVDDIKTFSLFYPLFAKGLFLPGKTIFLQAKTHQGKNGFYVLDVFRTEKGQFLLVQRGWSQTPSLYLPSHFLKIEGIGRFPSSPTYFQPKNSPPTYFWIDISLLSKELNLPLLPYYMIAKASYDPHILPTNPFPSFPNNHLQYAITWYSLAFFLSLIFLSKRKYFSSYVHSLF